MIDEKILIEVMLRSREREHGTVASLIYWFIQVAEACPKVGKWIPVSEKLPDTKSKPYKLVLIQTKTSMCVGSMNAAEQWFGEDGTGWGAELKDEVIAWMPLPEPYKGE